ncbi:MAG: tRNA (adenosine(37)-N6)-threonylcarbamoyltransferase complex transferase subunit TsaD [Planctomycetota bacterium]
MGNKIKSFICLGIETSCDETAASIVRDGKEVLADVVLSQIDIHSVYGGVVPEIACRAHIETILPIMKKALKDARVELNDISAVAVTNRPGLIGALLVGLSTAKTLAWVLNKPLIPINHIEAHLYVNNLVEDLVYPYVGLVVSGGHTTLFYVKSPVSYRVLGRTRDDAAGESFDKVAKMLGLGYPGGPLIEKMARQGNPSAIKFPRGIASEGSLDFSFSGLKTAVLYHCKGQNASAKTPIKKGLNIPDICASFQAAVVDTLTAKAFQAARLKKAKAIVLGGGVACNEALRNRFQSLANKEGVKLYLPAKKLCTDNAVMVATMAHAQYRASSEWRNPSAKQLQLDAYSTAQ